MWVREGRDGVKQAMGGIEVVIKDTVNQHMCNYKHIDEVKVKLACMPLPTARHLPLASDLWKQYRTGIYMY